MSRTHKTLPWKLKYQRDWPDRLFMNCGGHASGIKYLQREHNRRSRHKAKAELAGGEQPGSYQTRSSAKWDMY